MREKVGVKSLHNTLALLVAGICFAANAAEDDFLIMWQVNDPVVDIYGHGLGGEVTGTTTLSQMVNDSGLSVESWGVQVGVYDTGTGNLVDYVNLQYGKPPIWSDGDNFISINEKYAAGPTYANIGNYITLKDGAWTSGEYVFALELGYLDEADNFNQMAQSDKWSYTDFVTSASEGHNYIKSTQLQLPDTEAWTGEHFSQTPEPTSGMLVLFGLSFLALRRKQQEKGAA